HAGRSRSSGRRCRRAPARSPGTRAPGPSGPGAASGSSPSDPAEPCKIRREPWQNRQHRSTGRSRWRRSPRKRCAGPSGPRTDAATGRRPADPAPSAARPARLTGQVSPPVRAGGCGTVLAIDSHRTHSSVHTDTEEKTMKQRFIVSMLGVAALLGATTAFAHGYHHRPTFQELDKDGNGVLTLDEV